MKIDAVLASTPLKDVPAVAEASQEIGFKALWTSETQHNPFLPCALIAEHTATIQLGTAIAVSFARSPGDLAYTAWDLAAQSHGRFILGLGTQVRGHIERRFGMPWPDSPVGKLREQIQVIRSLWDCWQNGSELSFQGEYYKIRLMSPFFNPGPIEHPQIPIYIAGVNTGLAKLAGETCQGFHAHPFHSPRYLREVLLPAIRAGAASAGRQEEQISMSVTAFVATTPEEQNFVRSQIAFYASTPSYRPVLALHGWEEIGKKLSAHAARLEWSEMFALISDEILQAFCLVTGQDTLAEQLHARYEKLANRITLYSPFVPGERDGFWKSLISAF